MSVYLDASFLVAFFVAQQPLTDRACAFLEAARPALLVSDFAVAEFSSAIARLVRMREIAPERADTLFADFDAWVARGTQRACISETDLVVATTAIRRLDLNLRAPDAINIAIAQRTGALLATFDQRLAANATTLGVGLAGA